MTSCRDFSSGKPGRLTIESLDRQVRDRSAAAREALDDWAHASGRQLPVHGQLQLDDLRP